MEGDTQIKFLQYGKNTYIFALGRKYFELFTLVKAPSKVICSSSNSLENLQYQIIFHSTECNGKEEQTNSDLTGIQKMFQMCEVTMNLNYKTKKAYLDSSNVGLILGIVLPLLFIILCIIGYFGWRYHKEKIEVIQLESDKKKYYETLSLADQEKQ
ncbi:hypothetical protein IMG5_019290 [Ichthyophthirius multifiliis]|uniref:Transmembrane protein n=1 Tax=Ichthyophthirius multifiliis TaxID=5932 RepID=G0QKL3_ICHMU|nr:hypothetical protein IMG5_019290 [Ichthyophthirius multifiliis]EGR34245.1 hypothetical protein IMG5_019290 [Ichthyophthirius multifiliis]|eukprot:XP_004039549.1 hypothetical protein IMG5_019290 [Ichthyophthirius multifiliis]